MNIFQNQIQVAIKAFKYVQRFTQQTQSPKRIRAPLLGSEHAECLYVRLYQKSILVLLIDDFLDLSNRDA